MSVFAIFICPISSEILFVQQRKGKWGLPGGHKNKGEQPPQALSRECLEEIAVNIAQLTPAAQFSIPRPWKTTDAEVFVFFHRPTAKPGCEITAISWTASPPTRLTRSAKLAVASMAKLLVTPSHG